MKWSSFKVGGSTKTNVFYTIVSKGSKSTLLVGIPRPSVGIVPAT